VALVDSELQTVLELTRFGGHLNTMGPKPNLEDVHRAPAIHTTVSA
jgi:hypothetical protein